jgi:hypothetical protein
MAISFVNQAQTGSATVTLPTGIKVGDLIVLIGYRNTTTAPSLPTGYTAPTGGTVSANVNSGRICYKRAVGTESGTTVTMTNANVIQCIVYRGAWNIGGIAWTSNAASATTNIPAITMSVADGTSWVVCGAGSKQTTSQSTPAGLTIRGTVQAGTTSMLGVWDTNAGVSSSGARTSTAGSAVTGAGVAMELMASKAASTLADDFNDNSLDATKWATGTNGAGSAISEAGQQIQEAPASSVVDAEAYLVGVNFDPKYTLVSDAFFAKLASVLVANAATFNYLWVMADDSNNVRIQVSGSPRTIKVFQIVAGVETEKFSTTYDAVNHAWLKIRESGGTLFFDASADHNGGYTNLTSFANPISVASVYPKMNAYAGIVASPGTAAWDNFNTAPTVVGKVAGARQAVNRASAY